MRNAGSLRVTVQGRLPASRLSLPLGFASPPTPPRSVIERQVVESLDKISTDTVVRCRRGCQVASSAPLRSISLWFTPSSITATAKSLVRQNLDRRRTTVRNTNTVPKRFGRAGSRDTPARGRRYRAGSLPAPPLPAAASTTRHRAGRAQAWSSRTRRRMLPRRGGFVQPSLACQGGGVPGASRERWPSQTQWQLQWLSSTLPPHSHHPGKYQGLFPASSSPISLPAHDGHNVPKRIGKTSSAHAHDNRVSKPARGEWAGWLSQSDDTWKRGDVRCVSCVTNGGS